MCSIIDSVIIVNLQGTVAYIVGSKYKGLVLARIEDKSVELEDSFISRFQGYTESGESVFYTVNTPVEVSYTKIQHGVNCKKAQHNGNGYLHAEDDDRPYDVDGCSYCGRCHGAI